MLASMWSWIYGKDDKRQELLDNYGDGKKEIPPDILIILDKCPRNSVNMFRQISYSAEYIQYNQKKSFLFISHRQQNSFERLK